MQHVQEVGQRTQVSQRLLPHVGPTFRHVVLFKAILDTLTHTFHGRVKIKRDGRLHSGHNGGPVPLLPAAYFYRLPWFAHEAYGENTNVAT